MSETNVFLILNASMIGIVRYDAVSTYLGKKDESSLLAVFALLEYQGKGVKKNYLTC